ncbi:hypothetical protein C0584_06265 [Candidatus Parcubacteria bacterium]|nr:MAG: hypothetical protein C0584_06265 [Candidatus Parcubacteria bacterium]
MSDIVISNKEKLKRKKERILEDGIDSLFVVSDFDRTLTKHFSETHKVLSLVQMLREEGYLGEEYTKKARGLFEKYHPYEIDMTISFEEKNAKMEEWWRTHNQYFIDYGLNTRVVDEMVKKRKAGFRDGAIEFMTDLHENNIPLVIISASGLGFVIDDYLEKNKVFYKNTKIITNYIEFDEKGMAVGSREPVITTTNKYLAAKEHMSELKNINGKKKNIMLLGDSYEDEKMANSFFHEDILKIGFLNEKVDERLDDYKGAYDVVILNDGKMDYVIELLDELK